MRFQYESRDAAGQWWRSYGNELWEFDEHGYLRRREASINDVPIAEPDRRIFGPRPEGEHGQEFPLRLPRRGQRRAWVAAPLRLAGMARAASGLGHGGEGG